MVTGVTNETSATLPEEEPPGIGATADQPGEEPPGKAVSDGRRFFAHVPQADWDNWKWHFRNRITTVNTLSEYISLTSREKARLQLVTRKYPLSITPYYLSLIDPHDPNDPIRKQAVPSILEITLGQVGSEDPLEEKRDSVVPGLVHRYSDRVLMVLTDICPMLCRHCTRKREWRHGGWVCIGCEGHTLAPWLKHYKTIGRVHKYTPDEISLVGGFLKLMDAYDL